MENETFKTTAEIEVSKQMKWRFQEDLQNQINGFYLESDKEETQQILDNARELCINWTNETKAEYIRFITSRAELYFQMERDNSGKPEQVKTEKTKPEQAETAKKSETDEFVKYIIERNKAYFKK